MRRYWSATRSSCASDGYSTKNSEWFHATRCSMDRLARFRSALSADDPVLAPSPSSLTELALLMEKAGVAAAPAPADGVMSTPPTLLVMPPPWAAVTDPPSSISRSICAQQPLDDVSSICNAGQGKGTTEAQ